MLWEESYEYGKEVRKNAQANGYGSRDGGTDYRRRHSLRGSVCFAADGGQSREAGGDNARQILLQYYRAASGGARPAPAFDPQADQPSPRGGRNGQGLRVPLQP